ncbi:MAG: hypothetical protein ACRYF3_12460, partial [Janthinobacterium lividum]
MLVTTTLATFPSPPVLRPAHAHRAIGRAAVLNLPADTGPGRSGGFWTGRNLVIPAHASMRLGSIPAAPAMMNSLRGATSLP